MCCCAWHFEKDFLKKIFLHRKWGKWTKNGQQIGFFKFIGKFSHFLLNLVYNERLYYLLYSCTNPIFGKNLVPEIWAKMLLANQITGFLNQRYLQNKMMKNPNFLHVDTDLWKLEVD